MSIKTKAQLATEANANIKTNGNNEITGAIHNTMLNNTFDSLCSIVDNETWNGVKTFGSFPITPSAAPTANYEVANKKYVDDNSGGSSFVGRGTLSLSSTDVNNLGTVPQTIIAASGADSVTMPFAIGVKLVVTTPLSVGTQNLVFTHSSGDLIAYIDNATYTSSAGTYYWLPFIQGSKNVYDLVGNSAFYVGLSGGSNGTGDATMDVVVYYTQYTFSL